MEAPGTLGYSGATVINDASVLRPALRGRPPRSAMAFLFCAVLGGCALFPADQETTIHSVRRETIERHGDLETEPAMPADAPTPAPSLDEESLPDAVAATATPETDSPHALDSLPPDSPADRAALPPGAAPVDSVLSLIVPATPPQAAAALRLVEQGRLLLAGNQLARALEDFEKAIALDPTSPYGYYFLARTHYTNRRFDQADGFITRAATLGDRASTVWQVHIAVLQGQILEAVGRYPEARQAYQRALQADPGSTTAQAGYRRLNP